MTLQITKSQLEAASELVRRQRDGLGMFHALPHQDEFFLSTASEELVRGGNRCLAKGTFVATPSGPIAIEDLSVGDFVYDETGQPIQVAKTFSNGCKPVVDVVHRGKVLATCTENHQFLGRRNCRPNSKGMWSASRFRQKDTQVSRVFVSAELGQVYEPHAYALGALLGDGCSMSHTREYHISSEDATIPEAVAQTLGGWPKRQHETNYTYAIKDAARCSWYDVWCRGRKAHEKTCYIEVLKTWDRESLLCFVAGLLDTDGSVYFNQYNNLCLSLEMQAKPVVEAFQWALLALWQIDAAIYRYDRDKYVNGPGYALRVGSNVDSVRALRELAGRVKTQRKQYKPEYESLESRRSQRDWVAASVRDTGQTAETYDIHVKSPTNLYLLANGVVTHNSGKSTCAAVKFAAAARDRQVTLSDGTKVDGRLPHQKGRPLVMWVIGIQLNHIGATIHRLLFRKGLYRIIRDTNTGKWRSYRPWSPSDLRRERECQQSDPLIPPNEIQEITWERRGEKQFNLCTLKDGTQIYAYASTSEVKQGDPVDYIWIDEAIKYPSHVPEWQARLSDKKGRLLWSSWPTMANPALRAMTDRALEQQEEVDKGIRPHADVREFVLAFSENPFIDDEEKRKRLEGWSAEERRARDLGEYITDTYLIYPTFNKHVHAAVPDNNGEDDDTLADILRKRNGQPPANWTRELILDPGTSKPGVLLCAVPPADVGSFFVVYDEIYIPRLDADALATEIRKKTLGYNFERFIIDGRAGRQTAMGFGQTVESNYSAAFAANRLSCNQTGNQFTYGSDDEIARIGIVQSALGIRGDGTPKLRIVIKNCPNLVKQLETNTKKIERNELSEKPQPGQKDDLRVCLEYWLSRKPRYIHPPVADRITSDAHRYFLEKKQRRQYKQSDGREAVHCGPGKAV